VRETFHTVPEIGLESPGVSSLILTHILQTEVKSKMSALKKRLQREPAFPDGSPERRDHHGSVED
jgi:hypothetical protein